MGEYIWNRARLYHEFPTLDDIARKSPEMYKREKSLFRCNLIRKEEQKESASTLVWLTIMHFGNCPIFSLLSFCLATCHLLDLCQLLKIINENSAIKNIKVKLKRHFKLEWERKRNLLFGKLTSQICNQEKNNSIVNFPLEYLFKF